MDRIVVETRVSDDGLLQLTVPLGRGEAGRDVRVTIESTERKKVSPEEWRQGILSTAGGWVGDFERVFEGPLEERTSLQSNAVNYERT